jgi:hypothetical protein
MPVVTVYRHGVTGGTPPRVNSHVRAPRGDVGGWSVGATTRNTKFLYSVREHELDGEGFAITLTLRDCPASATVWHQLRRAWLKRMERAGMIRHHWVTEWQRRGVPHLHAACWWPEEMVRRYGHQRLKDKMINDWVMLTSAEHGTGFRSQRAEFITGAVGWFQYVSKHAARGVKHYQRSSENIPECWKKKTGRMWGHTGPWPVREGMRIELQDDRDGGDKGYFAWRRLVRSWRIAACRASGDVRRLRGARRMLRCHEAPLSRVRGISEWIGEDLTLTFLGNLAVRGYHIQSGVPKASDWKERPQAGLELSEGL